MNLRVLVFTAAAAAASVAAATTACVSSPTVVQQPIGDTLCQRGAIKAGDSLTGLLGAKSCRIVDLFSSETTFANGYTVALTSGKGYLLTMASTDSNRFLKASLELANGKKKLLAFDTNRWPKHTALTFVSDTTVTRTVRAAALDTLPGDFGNYYVKLQSCKVPVAPVALSTDSVRHADTLKTSDCYMPVSNFNPFDSSHVQLYSTHINVGSARTLTWNSPTPLVILIGPTPDTFASLPAETGADSTGSFSGSLEFAPGVSGNFTIVVGTFHFSTSPNPYTLIIGPEHAPTMTTQFSRSRSRLPEDPRQSTPPSEGRRGR